MKKASSVLYTIGNVFNIIALIIFILVACCVGVIDELPSNYDGTMTLNEYITAMRIVFIVFAVIQAAVLAAGLKAKKAVNDERKQYAPHVVMIVIGIIGSSLLYLIGGILGLLSENSMNNNN